MHRVQSAYKTPFYSLQFVIFVALASVAAAQYGHGHGHGHHYPAHGHGYGPGYDGHHDYVSISCFPRTICF